MEVNGIGAQYANLVQAVSSTAGKDDAGEFQNMLADALNSADAADALTKTDAAALLTGNTNNLHDAVIDSEKATLTLSLAVQIRNRVIDAYNEVMRMQI